MKYNLHPFPNTGFLSAEDEHIFFLRCRKAWGTESTSVCLLHSVLNIFPQWISKWTYIGNLKVLKELFGIILEEIDDIDIQSFPFQRYVPWHHLIWPLNKMGYSILEISK